MAWDNKCEHCGANLDAGEKCDCQTEEKASTDNEIITALWCCAESTCYKCPLENYNDNPEDKRFCYEKILVDAVETIKSLQAEEERLKKGVMLLPEVEEFTNEVKVKAITEFAYRLKAKQVITHKSKEGYCVYEYDDELIDNLVKEMKKRKCLPTTFLQRV